MGVGKGFWDVLKPVARMESLDSLRGKVLAIDLSFWIIQLLTRVKGIALRKPHIRLLFFRTIHLVARIGAFPVFVADGEPPPLKLQVRLNRFSRISGVPLNTFVGDANCKLARNNFFTDSINECMELLELLGMPVLRAKHEAEGLCAELQKQGIVNACVTPDSDAFLYGAEHVIKVLQADLKDPHVESYMMRDIESFLGLHREHLVALALLAGCDYNVTGVPGIGCQHAVRLIKPVPKHQIFERLRDWGAGRFECAPESGGLIGRGPDLEGCGEEGGTFIDTERANSKKEPHCSSCGHPGTKKSHTKHGCEPCSANDASSDQEGCRPKVQGFKCTCKYCTRKEAMKKHTKHEGWKMKVCHKIFETRGFPNENIIEIFMDPEHDTISGVAKPSLAWKSPRIEALEEFLRDHLLWDKAYVRQKLLPLLSFYCLKDTAATRNLGTPGWIAPTINGIYVPHSIQRIKILFSKPLFRLRWSRSRAADTQEDWLCLRSLSSSQDKKVDDGLDIMVSDIQTENLDSNLLFTTDEDMMLVKEAYPDLVSRFEQEQEMRKSKRKGESRRKATMDDLSGKQLRITSFFQSQKGGACSHQPKEISGIAVQGPTLDEKTQSVQGNSDTDKEVEPSMREEAVGTKEVESTFIKQDRSPFEITRAAHASTIHEGDILKDTLREDQSESKCQQIASTEVAFKADGKRNRMRNSRIKADVIYIEETEMEAGNKPEVFIEDVKTVKAYPCKANRVGNHSPGFQQRISSDSRPTPQDELLEVIDVDTTPPLRCWRELSEGKMTDTDLQMMRRCTKRVLFS